MPLHRLKAALRQGQCGGDWNPDLGRSPTFFPLPWIIRRPMSLRSGNIRASASPLLVDRAGVLSAIQEMQP
jgi:hypothetical protein